MDSGRLGAASKYSWVAAALLVAILVLQVAQPWRSYLAGWLVFVASGGWLARQVVCQRRSRRNQNHQSRVDHAASRGRDIPGRWRSEERGSPSRLGQSAPGGLTIVSAEEHSGQRCTIR